MGKMEIKKYLLILLLFFYTTTTIQAFDTDFINATSTATSTFAGSINIGTGNVYQIATTTVLNINGTNIEIGINNNAIGNTSQTIGANNTASGYKSNAIGLENNSASSFTSAIGYFNIANQILSSAIGANNTASGINSQAIGYNNIASGIGSVAIGNLNIATANGSIAIGSNLTNNEIDTAIFGIKNTYLTIASSTNFGIDIDYPQYKLDVNGDIQFTGNLYKNGILVQTYSYMQEIFYGILIWFMVVASIIWLIRRIT